ncbi:hypothetical protein ACFQFC_13090 [Amorphoplanes digitatis]|uniref:Uncharacterized protein n=1 Tax=Actinoplanes digitatis TaxID=1868 RepID=A0A7W7I2G8_9ACTN|nr:hypothetical protein [Actinoplanes digitatis]MBB4765137.1 hypothetical protein [Actinoplanes digitatis]GID98072.1 hypothetical protein Adi01nite_74840 [Actinoplanes digitatis]
MAARATLDSVRIVQQGAELHVHGWAAGTEGLGPVAYRDTPGRWAEAARGDAQPPLDAVAVALVCCGLSLVVAWSFVPGLGQGAFLGGAVVTLLACAVLVWLRLRATGSARRARARLRQTGDVYRLTGAGEQQRLRKLLETVESLDAILVDLHRFQVGGRRPMVDLAELQRAAARALLTVAAQLSILQSIGAERRKTRTTAQRLRAIDPGLRAKLGQADAALARSMKLVEDEMKPVVRDLKQMTALAGDMLDTWRYQLRRRAEEEHAHRVLRDAWTVLDGSADQRESAADSDWRSEIMATMQALRALIDQYGPDFLPPPDHA